MLKGSDHSAGAGKKGFGIRNAEYALLLKLAPARVELSVLDLVRMTWPTTQQALKKCKTVHGHLRRMQRRGWVHTAPTLARAAVFTDVRWSITPAGRAAGKGEQERRQRLHGDEQDETPRMRLVRD